MPPDDAIDAAFERWYHTPLAMMPEDYGNAKAWFALAFRAGAYWQQSNQLPKLQYAGDI